MRIQDPFKHLRSSFQQMLKALQLFFILGVCRVADSVLGTKGNTVFNIDMDTICLIANKDGIIDH